MNKNYEFILAGAEKITKSVLQNLIMDENSPDYGGVDLPEPGIVHDKSSLIAEPLLCYFNQYSKYFRDASVLKAVSAMLDFALARLHDDNTWNLYTCNMRSSPDTAFGTIILAKMYKISTGFAETEQERLISGKIYNLIERCSSGISAGGFHTPNHRWVISAALALSRNITKNETLLPVIERYLVEGIDCNGDGEFAERSAGGYNYINQYAMFILAEELDRPEYNEYALRNLRMMKAYFEPDMTVFTGNSTRQDYGTQVFADKYYPMYLYGASRLGEPGFAAIAGKIIGECMSGNRNAPECLDYLMLYPEITELDCSGDVDFTCDKYFSDSGIVRVIEDGMSLTLLRNNADFLHIRMNELSLFMRMNISFFNERHLMANEIAKTDAGYILKYKGYGKYYLPYGAYQGTSDWWRMDKSQRPATKNMDIAIDIHINRTEDGFDLSFESTGCTGAPVRLEINIANAVRMEHDAFSMPWKPGIGMVVKNGSLCARTGSESITVGPCFATHNYICGLFGSVPQSDGHMRFYLTDQTNFQRKLSIFCNK
jgi:hypothetical protein